MTKATFIKGPWYGVLTEPQDKDLAEQGIRGYSIKAHVDGQPVPIADCFPSPYSVEVSIENARLLAAAPDLLAACESAAAELGNHTSGAIHGNSADNVLGELRAALIKAKGNA